MPNIGLVSSITRTGAYEPFELQVSRGQITFHEAICIFGINAAATTSNETVWVGSSLYTFPASATTTTVSSTNNNDAFPSGTGAQTVFVEGLDANYNRVSEIVRLNGQTEVTAANQYLRVNRITVLTAGSNGTSAGAIYVGTGTVTSGVPANVINVTGTNSNESESGFYSVPAGYTAYVTRWTVSSSNATATAYSRFTFRVRPFGGVFNTKSIYNIPANGIHECDSEYPVAIPEKSDIEILGLTSVDPAFLSTQLQFVLIQNNYQI